MNPVMIPGWLVASSFGVLVAQFVAAFAWAIRQDRELRILQKSTSELANDVLHLQSREESISNRLVAIETDVRWIRRSMEGKQTQ